MSRAPEGPRNDEVRYRAQGAAEKRASWYSIVGKVLVVLVVGTVGLGLLFFGTCVLLMRH